MAKLTINQKLWLETTTNILDRINKLKKKGYDTSDLPTPPKRPEIITNRQLLELQKVEDKVKEFEKIMKEVEQKEIRQRKQTNLKVDFKMRNKIEQAEIKTGYHTVVWDLFAGIEEAINQAQLRGGGKGANLLREFVDLLKSTYGPISTAAIFYNAHQFGIYLTSDILYDSDGDKATQFMSHITNFIRDKEDWAIFKDTVIKMFDEYDTLEASEIYED